MKRVRDTVRGASPLALSLFVIALCLLLVVAATADRRGDGTNTRRTFADDYWHYLSVGNLGLSLTNFGVLGQGYNIEGQPSCLYKLVGIQQEQVEHFSYAGIWIGGKKQNRKYVSTAIFDGVFDYQDGGWEYTSSATDKIPYLTSTKVLPKPVIDDRFMVFRHLNKIDRRYDFSRFDTDSVIVFGGGLSVPLITDSVKVDSLRIGGAWVDSAWVRAPWVDPAWGIPLTGDSAYVDSFWTVRRWFSFGTTTWDTIVTQSTLDDATDSNPYADFAAFFSPDAISHQDLVCSYTDTNRFVPGQDIPIPNHDPLGIQVNQEAYAWYHPYADAFAILSYTVTNIPDSGRVTLTDTTVSYSYPGGTVDVSYAAGDTIWWGEVIEEPYFGLWVDPSVGNMHYTNIYDNSGGPGGRWNWYDNLNDFVDTLFWDQDTLRLNLALQYDVDGDAGWAQSYLGVKMLGAQPRTPDWKVQYNQWRWRSSESDFPMPEDDDESRYDYLAEAQRDYDLIPSDRDAQGSWMMLLSCGPMPTLAPGQRFNVTLSIVCAQWNGAGEDNDDPEGRRKNLYLNAEWAQIAYDGEDINGNGVLDPGEDRDGDGKITRYVLPEAPPAPQLVVVPEDNRVTLYWTKNAETTRDPISNLLDFEGYRIYGSPKTEGATGEWSLLADYDIDYILDPNYTELVGYNTGFEDIRVDSLADSVQVKGVWVSYKWVNEGVKPGWPRELYYAVAAYDRGDPNNNLPSLQSPLNANRTYVFPGTVPAEPDDDRVGVYPNPYKGRALWDGASDRDRLIWFRHLPARCRVTIFTLAGERVDSFVHDAATYNGDDVHRITGGASGSETRAFAGGEHAWDLLTENDQEIATGLYIFTVEDMNSGEVKTGKFLVIK